MTDPISAAAGGVAVGRAGIASVEFLWNKVREANVIAREFDPDGNPFDGGDTRISVKRIEGAAGHWWYRVVLVPDYEFVPYATNPHWEIRFTEAKGQQRMRDRMVFRWIVPPPVGFVFNTGDDAPNVETNFVVVGYKPSAIVKHFTAVK